MISTFEKSIAGRSAAGRDGTKPEAFRRGLRHHITIIRRKVFAGTYDFSAYKQHLLSKGAGKPPRVVAIGTVRDRLVLKALSNVIAKSFPDARTPMAPEKIATLIERLEQGTFDSFVRLDVKNFYPSIRHRGLHDALSSRIRSKSILALVLRSIRTPVLGSTAKRPTFQNSIGVPQGLPISNILAEIAMLEVDSELGSVPNSEYFRYVDDVLILCAKSDLATVTDDAVAALARRGLVVHEFGQDSKSEQGRLDRPFGYLGYVFQWPRITVRPESVTKLEDSITKVFTAYHKYISKHDDLVSRRRALLRCQLRLDLKISGCQYENARRGWISFYSQIRHQQLLAHLDKFVQKQVGRFDLAAELTPKTFKRSYRFAATRAPDTTGFVPNFDNLTLDETRQVLDEYFLMDRLILARLTEAALVETFRRKMHRLIVELERDAFRTS